MTLSEYHKAIRRLNAGIEAARSMGMHAQADAWASCLSYASRQGYSHLSATPEVYKSVIEKANRAAAFLIKAERFPDGCESFLYD